MVISGADGGGLGLSLSLSFSAAQAPATCVAASVASPALMTSRRPVISSSARISISSLSLFAFAFFGAFFFDGFLRYLPGYFLRQPFFPAFFFTGAFFAAAFALTAALALVSLWLSLWPWPWASPWVRRRDAAAAGVELIANAAPAGSMNDDDAAAARNFHRRHSGSSRPRLRVRRHCHRRSAHGHTAASSAAPACRRLDVHAAALHAVRAEDQVGTRRAHVHALHGVPAEQPAVERECGFVVAGGEFMPGERAEWRHAGGLGSRILGIDDGEQRALRILEHRVASGTLACRSVP